MAGRGRPTGPVIHAVRDALAERPKTAREVAKELLLSVDEAKNAVRRLHDRGEIAVADKKKIEGCKKPVRIYTAAQPKPAMMSANLFSSKKR